MVFHERRLPETGTPAGYAALIGAYNPPVPLPRTLSAIGARHRITEEAGWRLYTPRHKPPATLEGHLTFAKYEGLDLAVLKRVFLAAGPASIEALVRATPTGSYARRVWFLYEWLTGKPAGLPMPSALHTCRSLTRISNGPRREKIPRDIVSVTTCRVPGRKHPQTAAPASSGRR